MEEGHAVSGSEPAHDVQQHLHDALEKLSAIQRSVLLMRDYEGLSYSEIGADYQRFIPMRYNQAF